MTAGGLHFVDLSGYAFTGKHAVIDLMREIEGYHVPHFEFEFGLLRMQGGILDLRHALCEEWSPIRSDAAIRRFKRLVRRLGSRHSLRRPASLFEAVGWNYDDYYAGRFFTLSDAYVRELVQASWRAPWPYALVDIGGGELFVRKLLSKLRWPGALEFELHLARPAQFDEASRAYLEAVLSSNLAPETTTVVMHNAFEPYAPARSLRLFARAKAIVVDRDPRDNFVQGRWYKPFATSVEDFIARYRMQREATDYTPHPDVLRIRFEDLVLDYDHIVPRIFAHLGEPAARHVRPRQHFNPDQSRKNLGLWRAYDNQREIAQIAAALPEFCDDRL